MGVSSSRQSQIVRLTSEEACDELLDKGLRNLLSKLDDRLASALQQGDVRLVRVSWLLRQSPQYRIECRQKLEERERNGECPSPLLNPEEAVRLLRRGNRSVGVLSYGWLSAGSPDPAGARMVVLQLALKELGRVEALFWDFPSLHQNPPGGKRTDLEQAAFKRALGLMGDLYASAVGTTVLQLKEIPARPREFSGALALFGLAEGVGEEQVRSALQGHGEIESLELHGAGWNPPAVVRFATHGSALAALEGRSWLQVCAGADTLYNERSYDGREGQEEPGRPGDNGRGWCVFESAVSSELIARLLGSYPRLSTELARLPPKLLLLGTSSAPREIHVDPGALDTRVDRVEEKILRASFTGAGDKPNVLALYKDYVRRIADLLGSTLAFASSEAAPAQLRQRPEELPPFPQIEEPQRPPLRLAQACLIAFARPDHSVGGRQGGEGRLSLAKVDETGQSARVLFADGPTSLSLASNYGSQVALPWRPEERGDKEAFVEHVRSAVRWQPTVSNMREAVAELYKARKEGKQSDSADLVVAQLDGFVQAFEHSKFIVSQRDRIAAQLDAFKKAEQVNQLQSKSLGPSRQKEEGDALRALGDIAETLEEFPSQLDLRSIRMRLLGTQQYAEGQWLSVRHGDSWHDAIVESGPPHRLRISGQDVILQLHPWNHAPRQLPGASFNAIHMWYKETLYSKHSRTSCTLTGKTLDILDQCVAVDAVGDDDLREAGVNDVHSLCAWLHALNVKLRAGDLALNSPSMVLITAPAAGGKTTMVSQLVTKALADEGVDELIPILIKASVFQSKFLQMEDSFSSAWNWFDAFHCLDHEPRFCDFLRQAMMSRRALLLFDGLDEAPLIRQQIETHLNEVLGPQGHVIVATSRPAGVDLESFQGVRLMRLRPLSTHQQVEILERRLKSSEQARKLVDYVQETLPLDTETKQPITANPLMLAMVASISELRAGVEMPSSSCELYQIAATAMFERGDIREELTQLLQAVFFEAHVRLRRVVDSDVLQTARRSVGASESTLQEFEARVRLDQMPLVTMLQVEPLQLQASHLSFQEYFAARELCRRVAGKPTGSARDHLRADPQAQGSRRRGLLWPMEGLSARRARLLTPWECPAWFAGFLRLGEEMGAEFGSSIVRAAGVGSQLCLVSRLGGPQGDLATSVHALALAAPHLSVLHLNGAGLGNSGVQILTRLLCSDASSRRLLHLSLSDNGIGISGAQAIARTLKEGCAPRLSVLNVAANSIAPSGAEALADALAAVPELRCLSLRQNRRIGDKGAQALARSLSAGLPPKLEDLHLGWTDMGADGAEAVVRAVSSGSLPRLARLWLAGAATGEEAGSPSEDIGDNAAEALAEAIPAGALPRLRLLDVGAGLLAKERRPSRERLQLACRGWPRGVRLLYSTSFVQNRKSINTDTLDQVYRPDAAAEPVSTTAVVPSGPDPVAAIKNASQQRASTSASFPVLVGLPSSSEPPPKDAKDEEEQSTHSELAIHDSSYLGIPTNVMQVLALPSAPGYTPDPQDQLPLASGSPVAPILPFPEGAIRTAVTITSGRLQAPIVAVDDAKSLSAGAVPAESLASLPGRGSVPSDAATLAQLRSAPEPHSWLPQDASPQFARGRAFWAIHWGITRSQLQTLLDELVSVRHNSSQWSVYDLVNNYVKPITAGTGMGYSLMMNQEDAKKVNLFVSSAWGANAIDYIKAILRSTRERDVIFIDALALYQAEDGAGPSIREQIGERADDSPIHRVLSCIRETRSFPCSRTTFKGKKCFAVVSQLFGLAALISLCAAGLLEGCLGSWQGHCYTRQPDRNVMFWSSVNEWSAEELEFTGAAVKWAAGLGLCGISCYVVAEQLDHGGDGKVLVVPCWEIDIYTRLWCIYELFLAWRCQVPVEMAWTLAPMGTASSHQASCANPQDKYQIEKDIRDACGDRGFEMLDRLIRGISRAKAFKYAWLMFRWGFASLVIGLTYFSVSRPDLPCDLNLMGISTGIFLAAIDVLIVLYLVMAGSAHGAVDIGTFARGHIGFHLAFAAVTHGALILVTHLASGDDPCSGSGSISFMRGLLTGFSTTLWCALCHAAFFMLCAVAPCLQRQSKIGTSVSWGRKLFVVSTAVVYVAVVTPAEQWLHENWDTVWPEVLYNFGGACALVLCPLCAFLSTFGEWGITAARKVKSEENRPRVLTQAPRPDI